MVTARREAVPGLALAATSRRRRGWLLAGAALVVLAAAGAAYWFVYVRSDPARRADILIEKGDIRAAQVELRNALRGNMRDAALHLRVADLQMKLADPVAADREYKLALTLGADRWVVAPLLADALLAQGLNDEALRRTPATGPTPAQAAKNLYLRSVAQLALEDQRAAADTLAALRKVAPDSVEAGLLSARLAAARKDYTQTEADVDLVLQREPGQIDALLMKQQIVADRGDHKAALDYAARAVAASPWSAMARIRHATELMFAGQDDQAQADINAILDVQPRFIEAIYLDGILKARRGQFQDAALELDQLDPVLGKFPQALYYKALVAANLGQPETAMAYARRYNVLVPGDPDGVRLVARSDIAAGASDHAVPILQAAVAGGLRDAQVLDLLGSAQGNLGNTQAAIEAFQQALAAAPGDPVILTHLGLAEMQSGAHGQAFGSLARAAEIPSAPPMAEEALVSAAIADGDLVRARAALDKLRAKVGDSQQVGILAGMIEVRRQDLKAAESAFADTLRRFPASLAAKLDYAKVLLQQGRRLDAMALMAEVLARDPANIGALNSYVPLLVQNRQIDRLVEVLGAAHAANPGQAGFTATLADALTLSGDSAKAVTMQLAVRDKGPLPPLLVAALARAQAAAGQIDEAKANFREVLRMMPNDMADRTAYIDLLLRNKEYDLARSELGTGLTLDPHSFRFMSTLVELEAQTKGLDAGLALADTLRADPAHLPFATLLKGDALMRARRYNAAARVFLDEYSAAPAVPPLLRAAAAYAAAGQEDDAARLLQAWLAHEPDTPAALQDLAKLDLRANRLDQARTHLETLLTMLPGDATALNNLAVTYQLQNDPRARETAQKAYLQDGGADSADTLGWIMARQGEADAALPLLRQAAAQAPQDAAIQYHLAVALNAAGRPAEAVPVLKALLATRQRFADRAAAVKLLGDLSK
jgi:putative PEP-CTERM system TPR-repeat lipoprotein